MERSQVLLLLVGSLIASGPFEVVDAGETVSAFWDPPVGEEIEVDRAVALVEEVFATLQSRHVDRPNRSELISLWSSVVNPTPPSLPTEFGETPVLMSLFRAFLSKGAVEPSGAKPPPEPMTVREHLERLRGDSAGTDFELRFRRQLVQFLSQTAGAPALARATEARVEKQLAANAYVGLGVTAMPSDDAHLKFPTILPGGTAARAGLTNGVTILAIDGWNTQHQPISEAVERIRGPAGTIVGLRIRDQTGEREVSIRRDFVKFQTLHGWQEGPPRTDQKSLDTSMPLPLPAEIAYLRCSQLGGSTVHELREAEPRARHASQKVLILDLREPARNSDVKYARLIADALLDDGLLWREQDQEGRITDVRSDRDCLFRDFPIAVLIAPDSPPPQRLLAAILQESGRAILIEVRAGASHESELLKRTAFTAPPTPTGIYRLESCSLAEGRWSLSVPTARFVRANGDADWSIQPNFCWHEPVPEVTVAESTVRALSPVGARTVTEKRRPAVTNPALPESLRAFGPVGLAIAELRAILAKRNKS
jgi:hypothetical protein